MNNEEQEILDHISLSISNLKEARAYMNNNLPNEFIQPTDELLNTLNIMYEQTKKFING